MDVIPAVLGQLGRTAALPDHLSPVVQCCTNIPIFYVYNEEKNIGKHCSKKLFFKSVVTVDIDTDFTAQTL